MIKLASFRPQYFDNNGDQANIAVLGSHLEAMGHQVEITTDCMNSDFLLIGDSSIAAHGHFESELLGLVPELKSRLQEGRPTLLVGRSWEYLAPALGIKTQHGERISKFLKLSTHGHEIIGYHNSTLIEPRCFITGAFIGTTLFGPLLAKNPSILKQLALALGVELSGEFFEESERLANIVRETTTF